MSAAASASEAGTPPVGSNGRIARVVAWIFGSALLLLILLVAGVSWYTTTPGFQKRVGAEIVKTLEDSTGGRVELGGVKFNLWHLAIEVDGLIVHGLEAAGEPPYLAADKIFVHVKIMSFLEHAAGGIASHIGLSYLRVDHPQVHLIIDKAGHTNQPVPKHPNAGTTPLLDTLLDLKANDVQLANGVALLNDRAIPFDMAGRDLDAEVKYIQGADHYGMTLDIRDLRTRMKAEPEAASRLHLEAELGRDMAELKKFDFDTGKTSVLRATARVDNFAAPQWQAAVDGSLELRQISVLSGVDGLTGGTIDLNLRGRNCGTPPQVAQKQPSFWQRRHAAPASKAAPSVLPPDPDCAAGYLLVGVAKLHNAGFTNQYVRVHDVNGGAQLHITPTELLFAALTGYLPGGGSAAGELRISNWLGEVAPSTPARSATVVGAVTTANKTAAAVGAKAPVTNTQNLVPVVQPAHAYLNVVVSKIPLRTIMELTETKGYGDLGFDVAVSGPVKVEWGGPAADIADTVIADGDLKFSPTGVPRKGARYNIPLSGEAIAHYNGRSEVVDIKKIVFHTPKSDFAANGVLGVNKGDPLTRLNVDMTVRDLAEYDQLLTTIGFQANGKKGSAAIPVVLHGGVQFHGTAAGRLANLDVKGHLTGTQLQVKLGSITDTQIDSVVADAEYSPDSGLAVASSTIVRGTATMNVAGSFRPRKVVSRRGVATYVWDKGTAVDAKVQLANAQAADVLSIAGRQNVPLTGTMNVNAHVAGTAGNLNGGGQVSLQNGAAYGENYESAVADLVVQGTDVEASRVVLKLHGMQITGNGGYDTASSRVHAHLEGNNLALSKFDLVKARNLPADGVLTIAADANGTLQEPNLKASVKLTGITYQNQAMGEIVADLHSEKSTVFYNAHSTIVGATLEAVGQTQLTGNYETQARVTIAGLDVAKPLAIFAPGRYKAQSAISGVITISGPAKTPMALNGTAELDNVDVKLQGIELKAAEPMRVSLRNGVATLEQVHITGPDTDLHATGTAQVFGAAGPKGGKIDIKADGSVSAALLHTFDPDILASGKASFTVAAGGYMKQPSLGGNVTIEHVNVAVDGVPNGLTDMNGTLVFNEDRLEVQKLTATTGGGQLNLGGFLTYKNGVYADLTATGEVVRVRLYGLSATANAKFHLQGGPQSALLSGNVLMTRFGVGPNVDFAAFAGTGGVSAPPDPNSASNKIRLDVHITSSPQLDFQNSYAKLAGTVDLTIRGTVAEPSVLGRVQITDGSATFAGTKYQLQRGDIYFTNPVRIDPIIDLDATARVENYDITIGLHGTTTNLKPTYRSEPPLSEADVFALLALGRTQEEAQLYQEQQVQSGRDPTTSALLGGALNATVSNRVEKLFGVGSVKIDPAFVGTLGNSSARITVQQQLSQQLTLTFATNVNQAAQQLIQLQYNLNRNTSIVATRDETGVFSVVYKIRKRYR